MLTIEQIEGEILQRSGLITEGLILFHDNIDNLGSVIGKDPRHVYDVLLSSYDSVMADYQMTTRRNVEILSGYIVRLDKILSVLTDVTFQIQNLQRAQEQGTVSEIVDEVGNALDTIAGGLEDTLADRQVVVERDMIKTAIVGVAGYATMRFLGFSRIVSLAVAAGSAYMLTSGTKAVKKVEEVISQI